MRSAMPKLGPLDITFVPDGDDPGVGFLVFTVEREGWEDQVEMQCTLYEWEAINE